MIRKMFNKRNKGQPWVSRKPMDKSLSKALLITAAFTAALLLSAPLYAERLRSDCIYNTDNGDDKITFKIVDDKLYIQDARADGVIINNLMGGGYTFTNEHVEVVIYSDGQSTISPFMDFPAYYGQCTEFVRF